MIRNGLAPLKDTLPLRSKLAIFGLRENELVAVQAMCAQTMPPCFTFNADLIELLEQSADDLRDAIAPSFPNLPDLEVATKLMTNSLVESAATGERNVVLLRRAALAALQRAFPSVSINKVSAPSLLACSRQSRGKRRNRRTRPTSH